MASDATAKGPQTLGIRHGSILTTGGGLGSARQGLLRQQQTGVPILHSAY